MLALFCGVCVKGKAIHRNEMHFFFRLEHMWEQMSMATSTITTPHTSEAETGGILLDFSWSKHILFCGRWVIYNPKHGVDYDASMVPATWFGWLHYKTDKTPLEKVFMLSTMD